MQQQEGNLVQLLLPLDSSSLIAVVLEAHTLLFTIIFK